MKSITFKCSIDFNLPMTVCSPKFANILLSRRIVDNTVFQNTWPLYY